jgi:hypothetical protein
MYIRKIELKKINEERYQKKLNIPYNKKKKLGKNQKLVQ